MARRRIGVDVGSTAVRAAELSVNGGKPSLVRVAQVPIEPGAVANGEVREPEAVAEALRELWRQGKFHGKEVVLGVGNQRVVVREVTLPWLSEKELRDSLQFQVQEYVPIPVEEAVLDYQVIEEYEHEGRRMLRLLLVAAQKAMVQQIVSAAEAAKLQPVGMDLIPFAIMRSVGVEDSFGMNGDQGGDEAVVDIGADVTSICVHKNGLPRFVRMLPSGGRDVTASVARALSIQPDEAETLKRGGMSGLQPDQAETASRAVSSRAAAFVDEIRSSLDFYESQMPGARIQRVLLTGGGSKLDGLTALLDERLPAQVVPGHPFHRVNVELNLEAHEMAAAEPLLAVAVGLAIPGGEA